MNKRSKRKIERAGIVAVVTVFAFAMTGIICYRKGYDKAVEVAEERAALLAEEANAEVEKGLAEQIPLTELFPAAAQIDEEAEAIARVLYGQCRWNSTEAQTAVAWLILNRVDSSLYPDSVIEVCEQPSQWMGEGNQTYTDELYTLAQRVLTTWKAGGARGMDEDFLFMTWSQESIEFRTSFNETSTTRYYRVG